MKTIYKFSLLIVINFFFLSTINAQSSNCDATVPTMFANLSGNNDSVWISPLINRLGRCCGTSNPDVCLRFIITLDTDVAGIQFNIASGAIPGGSMFYQIDCGPQVAVGSPICMTSGTHELTFCKPGNNSNTYSITSVPKPNISVVPVQNQCSDAIQIDGLVSSSITINSVYPGSYGQYNNYLNCQFGCNYSEVNAIGSTPEYIDYVVCGNVLLPECSENSIFCDTVRIHFVDNLNTSLSTNSIFPCSPLDTAKLIGNFYGGMPPYTWFWTDNINGTGNMITTDSIANITTTGIFSFVVRDSRYPRCNQKILNISVSMPSSLLNTTLQSTTNVNCFAEANGAIDINVTGGTTPYNYNWSNGATTQDITNLTANNYQVTITDANGCSTSIATTISQPNAHLNATIQSTTNVNCFAEANGAIDINVTGGTTPYNYNWSNGATTQDITNLTANNYQVTITDTYGCSTTLTTTISQPNTPLNATIQSTTNVNCFAEANGAIDINVNGGTTPYIYNWSNGATTQDITNLTANNYQVTITDTYGCSTTLTTTISQPNTPLNATIQSTTNVNCFAEANGAIDINVNGGTTPYNYNWNNGATSQDITNLTVNNYQVTITDANGCSTSLAATISQPNAPLNATIQSTTNINCFAEANGAIDINVNGGTTPYNYNWNNGATSQDISNLTANNYQVTITDANGCSTSIATTISQPNAPLNANTTKENPMCFGASDGSATMVVTGGTDPYNYTWNNNLSSPQLTQISSGEYSVTVTDANGCSIIRSILLTDPQPISIYSVQTPTTCNNDNGTIVLTVNGGTPGYTYHWSENYTGMHTSTITGLSNNTYTVTVTDANGCSESVSTNVEKILPPNLILASQTNESCSNSNGSIIVAVVNGTAPFHYNWNINSNTNTNFRNSLQAGHYFVIVTDQEGCKDTLYSNIINHEAPSIAVLSTTPSHCSQPDGAINILVTGGSNNYQYHWSTNATSSNITQLTPGNYSVTVTDGYCSVSEFISISNTSSPKASLSVNRFHALLSDASFIFSNLSTNYTSCIWDFGDNTTSTLDNPTHVYSNYGVYTVTLTVLDEFGCSSTESLIVNVTTELIVWVPNTFTPNGDGVNENFGPIATGYSPEGYHLFIYDRWGQKVFESKDYGDRWEGNIKEDSINSSYVYSWILVIYDLQGKPYKFKGNVTLLGAN